MSKNNLVRPAMAWQQFRLSDLMAILVCACLFSMAFLSCHGSDAEDIYVLSFKLDSTKVGKFDSVQVEIFNGKPPAPGDIAKPVQTRLFDTPAGITDVKLELSKNVNKDFYVVVTGFDSTGTAYRKLHTYEDFAAEDNIPSVLLVSRITPVHLTLNIGETRKPVFSLFPAEADDQRVLMATDDSTVAVVMGDSVKGLKSGRAIVTVSTVDGRISAGFFVTVTAVRVSSLSSDDLQLQIADSLDPAVKVLPANASDADYTLMSSDSLIVRAKGHSLLALKAGSAKIRMASVDGGARDSFTVTVRLPVLGLTAQNLSKSVGDQFIPDLTWNPADATDRNYILNSKDTTLVKVVGDSLLAMKAGTDSITVTSNDGAFRAGFTVTVADKIFPVVGVRAKDLRALVGDTLDVDLTWDPVFASDKGFELKSLDTNTVAVLGQSLQALGLGKAEVELTTADGGIQDTFTVAVENANFTADVLPITAFKCAPCHAPGQVFNWQDSAQLVRKGTIALDRITRPDTAGAKMPLKGAQNGPLTKRELSALFGWLKRVSIPVINVTATDTTVNLGDTLSTPLVWEPANASNQLVTLTTSDSNFAVVRSGLVITNGIGTATISAQTDEGDRKLQFKVTVKPPSFQKNVLPIVVIKCAPCHVPNTTFNWQDSVLLVADGSQAINRLKRPTDTTGRMPLTGSPNGDLTAYQLKVLLGWLESKVVPLKGITVSDDSIPLGSMKAPAIVFTPTNASNKSYQLLSGDEATLTVEGDQMVGKALGSTQVEVKAFDGGFSKLITVKVVPIYVDSLRVRDTSLTVGDTIRPVPRFFPVNTTDARYTLKMITTHGKIRVDSTKVVVGLAIGMDTVEAVSVENPAKKDTFSVAVGPVLPKAVSIPDTNGSATLGIKPRVIFTPANTTNKAYTLSIPPADTGIAVVKGDSVKCKSIGVIMAVTATSNADPTVKTTFKFTVGPVPVDSIKMAQVKSYVAIGSAVTPVITFYPANATNKNYTLTVPTASAASLTANANGTLTSVHLDSTVITLTTADGSKTALWTVVSTRPPWGSASVVGTVHQIIATRCIECHYPGSAYPNWQDSTLVIKTNATVPPTVPPLATNPEKIINRISVLHDMPPSYALNTTPLTTIQINTIVDWLNKK